jgi:tRNA threonylcarbamoyladenosine biosynthesis protein TsaB
MKILAFDTATRCMALGFLDGDRVYEYDLVAERRLSALLGPSVQRVLDTLGWRMDEIDYFACGIGPGSFTAVRIGMAMMKGLAWSLHRPVAGISTLDIIARNAPAEGYVVPVMDARRGLVYTAVYAAKSRQMKRVSPYRLVDRKDLFKLLQDRIPRFRREKVVFLGDGLDLLRNDIPQHAAGAVLLDKDYWYPKGHTVIELAVERIREKKLDDAFSLEPIYLYPKECQIKTDKRQCVNIV